MSKRIKSRHYKCNRCGHRWTSRKNKRPTICSRCKSPFWDRSRRLPKWKRDMIVVEPVG